VDTPSRPSKNYQRHRESQRERILEAAEMLFVRDGLDHVSMSSIAGAARIARITLYEYFPNKEEIAWAIFQQIIQDLRGCITSQAQAPGASGYQRIEAFMMQMVRLLEEYPKHFRFIVEFNQLYARQNNPSNMRQVIDQQMEEGQNSFPQMVQEGIADGSLRPDLDPDLLSAAILNLLSAVSSRFALLGSQVSEEYGQSPADIYNEICRAFLRGIQAVNMISINKEKQDEETKF
jgi:AcrR family transcriptional regulator